jgi:hypothetical protein
MYLLDPTTAIDLARHRVEQDLARAEASLAARQARAARRSERRTTAAALRARRRFATVVRGATPRFGH